MTLMYKNEQERVSLVVNTSIEYVKVAEDLFYLKDVLSREDLSHELKSKLTEDASRLYDEYIDLDIMLGLLVEDGDKENIPEYALALLY